LADVADVIIFQFFNLGCNNNFADDAFDNDCVDSLLFPKFLIVDGVCGCDPCAVSYGHVVDETGWDEWWRDEGIND